MGSKPTICSVTHTLSVSAFGSVAQIWRAPALQAGGCGCDACQIHHGPSSSRLRTAASQAANRGSKPRGPTNAGRGWCPGRAHTLAVEGSIPSSATSSWHAALRREDYPEPVRPCKAPACPMRVWQRGRSRLTVDQESDRATVVRIHPHAPARQGTSVRQGAR